jgi:hypothetical protein
MMSSFLSMPARAACSCISDSQCPHPAAPLLMAELAACFDQHGANNNTVLYRHWSFASKHP